MKLWERERNDADPWDRPEQDAGPFDAPEQEDGTSAGFGLRIAGAVMTAASYAILFRLPDEMGLGAYAAFFLSILLFALGFFWVVADFPKPASWTGAVLRNGGICAASALLMAAACVSVAARGGSEGGVVAATVLMIQSIMFLSGLDDDWKERGRSAFRAVSVGIGIWVVVLFFRAVAEDSADDGLIAAMTLLLIMSVVLFGMFGKGGTEVETGGKRKKKRRKNENNP